MKLIAEIGLNHCGSEQRAMDLLEKISATSVDAFTFQIRERKFYDGTHPRKKELPDDFYRAAVRVAKKTGKQIGFAIAQPEKIGFLQDIGADFWKSLSWDLTNTTLQKQLHDTGKKNYISTGVSGLPEIVEVARKYPDVDFIHTQLDYETANVNLRAIDTIRQATNCGVAFGSHCRDSNILYVAVAFSPSAIFFYVKDETDGEHPDDYHAVRISQVEALVNEIRSLKSSLGHGEKKPLENKL